MTAIVEVDFQYAGCLVQKDLCRAWMAGHSRDFLSNSPSLGLNLLCSMVARLPDVWKHPGSLR